MGGGEGKLYGEFRKTKCSGGGVRGAREIEKKKKESSHRKRNTLKTRTTIITIVYIPITPRSDNHLDKQKKL